jgi:hypothetical protein
MHCAQAPLFKQKRFALIFEIDPASAFIYGGESLKYAALYLRISSFEIPKIGHVIHLEEAAKWTTLLENTVHDHNSANV